MAAGPPLSRLVLRASSVADDMGYVALADLGRVLEAGVGTDYRVIGGHMVTALVARWQLGAEMYRETGDADLGIPSLVVQDQHVVRRLMDLGYAPVSGNRFARSMRDVPVGVVGGHAQTPRAVIDVLVPATTSRARSDRKVGDDLTTIEVLGLQTALHRPPVVLPLQLERLNGERLEVEIVFPDEVAALVLKAFATRVRDKPTDIVDVWRCLEVAYTAGIGPDAFTGRDATTAAALVRALFERRDGPGMAALVAEQGLSASAADARFTRMRALVARVLGA